jgi:diguanylate cyclase (GGDEF)-like protein
MENNNLPMALNRKNILLDTVKRYINKLANKADNKQIINNFKDIKQYSVLSMPAFRMIVDEMIQKSPEGSIIMADINDLFVANKFRGKEKVNGMIKNIINSVKTTLDENQCQDYKIGKMGDEIYIYVPDKNEEEAKIIFDKLKEIKENELTISLGSSSNLSKGLISAINEADKKMTINKSEFKSERLKSICGNDLEKIIDTVVEIQLDKMRIDLQQLKSSNKPDLRNTFDKAIEQLDIDVITSEMNKKDKIKPTAKEDIFDKLKKKYINEGKALYGENSELINEHVLANMLSKHPVEGVINSEFFQGLEYKKAFKSIKKDKAAKSFDILAIDLSGLKGINDTYGHEEGDNAIFDALKHLQTTLKHKDTKMYSNIIAKGGGNSYVLIEKLNNESKNEMLSDIQKYGTDKDSKYNMSIICSIQNVDKSALDKSNFLTVVNNNLTKVEDNLQHQSFDRKLKDVEEIKNSIKKIYQQVINMDDIQVLSANNLEHKEEVLEMVKTGFENCIHKERNDSSLNIPNQDLTLEKHKLNNKNLTVKDSNERNI